MKNVAHDTLIFIPTYNEAGNIGELLRMILELALPADILVIDDSSADGTADVVLLAAATAPSVSLQSRSGKLGIGSAHLRALHYAKERGYRILVTMDGDFSHQPSDISRFLQNQEEYDVVVGSRFEAERSLREWSALRKIITHLGHFLTKTLLSLPYDATGAFRLYRLDRIPDELIGIITSQHYEFFFESIAIFHEAGLKIGEIPIVLPRRTYGHSKMQIVHMLRGIRRLLQLSHNLALRRQFRKSQQSYYHPEQTREEWNVYWGQREPRPEYNFYEIVASFYRKNLIKRALNYFVRKTFKPGERLLHAGCGGGEVDEDVVAFANVTALDISPAAVSKYNERLKGVAVVGDIFHLPPDGPRYDGIYNLGVMEHFSPDEIHRILVQFNRALSVNGRLLLFWPPVFGLSVFALRILRWLFRRVLRRDIVFHPAEPSLLRSRKEASKYLDEAGFQLREFYFGMRDAFTYVVVVADKRQDV